MKWALRFGFGKGMVSIDASQVCLELFPNFHRKFGSILPYFHGGNPTALHLKCVIAHKTLFSPSFHRENMAMAMPHFHMKKIGRVHIWCPMAHQQNFMPVYTACANMLVQGQAGALQNSRKRDIKG